MLSERVEAWLRRHVLLVDGALALLIGVPSVLAYERISELAGLISAGLVLPFAIRRRFPVAAAVIILGAAFVQWLTIRGYDLQIMVGDVGVLVAIYSVTAFGPRWARWAGLAAGLLGAVLGGELWPVDLSSAGYRTSDHVFVGLALGIAVVAVWAIGRLRGVRWEQLATLRERARLLEVERDQRARLAVSTERARIAREMHDVVAHSLAVMIAQADGGRYAATDSPRAQAVLGTIGETGRQALAEMRRLLAVLREEVPDGAAHPATLGPQPGLDDVPALVERVRAGGLPVTLRLPAMRQPDDAFAGGAPVARTDVGATDAGSTFGVEPGIGLVVYRIVQEGLTNVIKHAGPAARVEVVVRWEGPVLRVSVVDDGRGAGVAPPPVPGAGQGLVGMRERAATFGGTIQAGPLSGGGYAVHARIPAVSR